MGILPPNCTIKQIFLSFDSTVQAKKTIYGARRHLKKVKITKFNKKNVVEIIIYFCLRARINLCFTNMSVQIISGLRLTWQRDIVSCPPEKICSMATADPEKNYLVLYIF